MAFLGKAFLVRKNARKHTRNRVGNNQRGQLAARQNIVANRNFLGLKLLDNTLVNTLVMPAEKRDVIKLRKLLDPLLS